MESTKQSNVCQQIVLHKQVSRSRSESPETWAPGVQTASGHRNSDSVEEQQDIHLEGSRGCYARRAGDYSKSVGKRGHELPSSFSHRSHAVYLPDQVISSPAYRPPCIFQSPSELLRWIQRVLRCSELVYLVGLLAFEVSGSHKMAVRVLGTATSLAALGLEPPGLV
ncbi:hypothetical protein OBBRIDRAFT_196359 [Obba rivulosa]|uniref:Uncharacterized protein n=1 Tax=Obba rivulosa TaxID=1052685 RepID=A0A8E2DQV3_9APHY|nr:hypothetical protein OBBRIDRAFT_196359 [Obba rivulosa]